MTTLTQVFILLTAATVALTLPLLIISYGLFRLKWRWRNLLVKIQELNLEKEYLRIFQHSDFEDVQDDSLEDIKKSTEVVFRKRFWGENSLTNYIVPFLLTLSTTIILGYVILKALYGSSDWAAFLNRIIPLAVAGGMLYVYPLYVSRYCSLFLTPSSLYVLLGRLWLSVILGVVLASLFDAALKPAAAFLGGLLPVAALDFIVKKVFEKGGDKATESATGISRLREIIDYDEDLLSQLTIFGVRTPLDLAYINPIKLFVETDLEIDVCLYLVDRANLCLYVPDKSMRDGLNKLGIKTAVDIMTQLYEYPDEWIEPGDSLPGYLQAPLGEIAKVLNIVSIDTLRNVIDIMSEDPKLMYLLDFWQKLNKHITKNSEQLTEDKSTRKHTKGSQNTAPST